MNRKTPQAGALLSLLFTQQTSLGKDLCKHDDRLLKFYSLPQPKEPNASGAETWHQQPFYQPQKQDQSTRTPSPIFVQQRLMGREDG